MCKLIGLVVIASPWLYIITNYPHVDIFKAVGACVLGAAIGLALASIDTTPRY